MRPLESVWTPVLPVDLRRTLTPLVRGRADPSHRVATDGAFWRTTWTPDGPATLRLTQRRGRVPAQAWGPGAERALSGVPDLLGARDDLEGFVPRHPLVAGAHARHPGLRLTRTGTVFEQLVPAVLEQKVTGAQARDSYRRLLLRYGEPAPGPAPAGMRVPPPAQVWARIPSWEWHRAGVDPRRMRTVLAAARLAARLEQATDLAPDDALTRLRAVPGVGEWTAAEVAQRALGHADTISVGDYHLSQLVGWALVGRPLDDEAMVALLEPWRPHRQRVVRLIEASGVSKPRFGPRLAVQDHRAI